MKNDRGNEEIKGKKHLRIPENSIWPHALRLVREIFSLLVIYCLLVITTSFILCHDQIKLAPLNLYVFDVLHIC